VIYQKKIEIKFFYFVYDYSKIYDKILKNK